MLIKDILNHFEENTENVVKIEEDKPLIDKYIFTNQIIDNYKKLFNFLTTKKSGINLYGDFGSGKSHFINVFNYMIKNKNSDKIPLDLKFTSNIKTYNIDLSLHTNFENISEIITKKILNTEEKLSADKLLDKISKLNPEEKVIFIFDEVESFSKIKDISLELQGFIHASESFFNNIKFLLITQNKIENIGNLKSVKNRISLSLYLDDYNLEEVMFERILKKKDEKSMEKIFEENAQDIIFRAPEIKSKNNYKINDNRNNKKLFSKVHPLQPFQIDILEDILKQGENLSNRSLIYTIHNIIKKKYLNKEVKNWITISDIYDSIYNDREKNDLFKTISILEKTIYSEKGVPTKILSDFMYKNFEEKRETVEKRTDELLKELIRENKIYIFNDHIKTSTEKIMKIENIIEEKSVKLTPTIPIELLKNLLKNKSLENININFEYEKIQNKKSSISLEIFYDKDEMKLRRQAIKNKDKIYLLLEKSEKLNEILKKLAVVKNLRLYEDSQYSQDYLSSKYNDLEKTALNELSNILDNSLIINSKNKPKKSTNFPKDLLKHIDSNLLIKKSEDNINKKELEEYKTFMENINFEIKIFPEIKLYIKDLNLAVEKKSKKELRENYNIFKNSFEELWKKKFGENIILKPYQSNYKNISLHDLI
jgi:hypothetical protein